MQFVAVDAQFQTAIAQKLNDQSKLKVVPLEQKSEDQTDASSVPTNPSDSIYTDGQITCFVDSGLLTGEYIHFIPGSLF